MQQHIDLSPVDLRYAAALRGMVPPAPEQAFRYVRLGGVTIDAALGLAASNPEGRFIFVLEDEAAARSAQAQAQRMRLNQCHFINSSLPALAANPPAAIQDCDYLCLDLGAQNDAASLQTAQRLAKSILRAGGTFACRYAPFAAGADGLRFMVAEFAPEMHVAQHIEFLHELKALGTHYFAADAAAAAALDKALGAQNAHDFLQQHGYGQSVQSATVQMIAGLAGSFSFAGDALVQANYLEMMVPPGAQDVLYALRDHLLYEVIKDFATGRGARTDLWIKQPAATSNDFATLFGNFYFGLQDTARALPDRVTLHGQTLDVTTPLFHKLLTLLRVMPLTIGDFLSHPDGAGFTPHDAVMAMHALVAFGVAVPMRSSFAGLGRVDTQYPRLAGAYNQQLREQQLRGGSVMLASVVAGRPVQLPLAEALVLQAVGRVGLAESADALIGELQRIAGNPEQAASIFQNGTDPAPDFAEELIKRVCRNHMVDWYALGILDAA